MNVVLHSRPPLYEGGCGFPIRDRAGFNFKPNLRIPATNTRGQAFTEAGKRLRRSPLGATRPEMPINTILTCHSAKQRMLSIGTLYAHGYSQDQLDLIQSLGFSLRPASSTYPGAQSLRFIDFINPPELELIHVHDELEYSNFIPPGMTPYCPGISLVVDPNSTKILEDYKVACNALGPYCLHFDYSGGNDPAKPGTNYLNFATPPVEKTFIYLTQYQVPIPELPTPPTHPNTASRVSGLVFNLPGRALASLFALWGQDPSEDAMALGGLHVYTELQVPNELKRRKKPFPLVAVVVTTGTPMTQPGRGRPVIGWLGKQALLAEMNPLSWDIILTP